MELRRASDLRSYQLDVINAIAKKKQLCVFSDPGSGKTAAILYAIKKLKISHTLVVAPKLVCETVWRQEASKWVGLKSLTFTSLCAPKAKRAALLEEATRVHLVTYDLLPKLIDEIRALGSRFQDWYDAVVFDEVSNLKSPGSKRFKRLRSPITHIPIRIGATGTPIGNDLLNLWGEMYMCAGALPLGRTFTDFRNSFFKPDQNGWNWDPHDWTFEEIKRRVKPFSIMVSDSEYLPRTFAPIEYQIPAKWQKEYQELSDNFYVNIDGLDVSGIPAVVKNKLRQFESGAIYEDQYVDDFGRPLGPKSWLSIHDSKLTGLVDWAESLQGQQAVVVYHFNHEIERLKSLSLSLKGIHEKGALSDWLDNKFQLLAIHPASAGHGLNLHTSGCKHLCFFTLPWSFELYKQTIGRLTRIGQNSVVIIHYFHGPDVENQVYRMLQAHGRKENAFMDRVCSTAMSEKESVF